MGCQKAGRCGYSDRREEYQDLSLQIQGCKDLDDCLERYFLPEEMSGDNKCVPGGAHAAQLDGKTHAVA